MANKWHWYAYRQTLAGHGSWGGSITDLNDENNITNVVMATSTYPTTDATSGDTFGISGTAGTFSNVTMAQAGNDPRLAGNRTRTGGGQNAQFDLPGPGTYNFMYASGTTSGGQYGTMGLFDGSLSEILSAIGSVNQFKIWTASTTWGTTDYIVSTVDLGFWKCTHAGAGSTVQPSGGGAGDTFTDGAATWTKLAVKCVALVTNANTTTDATYVIDQNGVSTLASAWGDTTPLTITVSGQYGNSVSTIKNGNTAAYPRVYGFQLQAAVLTDVELFDRWGDSLTTTPTINANEVIGLPIAKIVASTGTADSSAFTLGGDLGSYFTVSTIGSSVWLVQSTRIPDSLASTKTLTITQTSDGDTGSPYTTSFSCVVVSSQGKPTDNSGLGEMPTQQWLLRKTIKDVVDSVKVEYTDQAFASDTAVTSAATFDAALTALTPDGTSWYRIRLQNGTYEGLMTSLNLNFGTGGLLIEPDTGQNPEISVAWQSLVIKNLLVRNVTCVPDKTKMGGVFYQWRFTDPGPSNGFYTRARFENCKFGIMFGDGYDETNIDGVVDMTPLIFEHGELADIEGCTFDGTDTCIGTYGVRAVRQVNNDFQRTSNDHRGINNAEKYNSTQDVFSDNHSYIWIEGDTTRHKLDYAGYANSAHRDELQVRTIQPTYLWTASWGRSSTAPYIVGDYFLNMNNQKLYTVTAVDTGYSAASGTGPTGTGTGITDGGITVDYLADYTTASNIYVHFENVAVNSASHLSANDTGNMVISNNGGRNCNQYWSFHNCILANWLARGIGAEDGEVWMNRCTLLPGSDVNVDSVSITVPYILRSSNLKIFEFKNLRANKDATALGKYAEYGCVQLNFASTAVSPNRPTDNLRGSFTIGSANYWTYPTFQDDGLNSQDDHRSGLSHQLHLTSGAAGARLTESHQVSAGSRLIKLQIKPQLDDPLSISGTPPATITHGESYSFTPTVTGGETPYSFSLDGTLPSDLSFDTDTGSISGTSI